MRNRLYEIFESHLLRPEPLGDMPSNDFIDNVVLDYLQRLTAEGGWFSEKEKDGIVNELRDEVLEMFRKKTYGFTSLQHFRSTRDLK